jgi:acetylornithine deacetylase/succinyl-diaminopimelate desuccinylase-like protein
VALAVERAALDSGSPDTVGTTGVFRIEPGAVNSVPFKAYLEIDLRDTDLAARDSALRHIEDAIAEISQRRGVRFEIEKLNADAPAQGDVKTIEIVEGVCATSAFAPSAWSAGLITIRCSWPGSVPRR